MRTLAIVGLLAILAALFVSVFAFGGYYDVSAQQEDSAPVALGSLARLCSKAIERRAVDIAPADFQASTRVQAGARAFSTRGCVTCHGGPGADWAKFAEGLNPWAT